MRKRRNLPSSSSSGANKKLDCSRVYKRRPKDVEHETGINDLPEHILHQIFSFLDIKQAIQTCILSRRWRYFWVSIPTLNFNYKRGNGYLETRKKGDFMDFVDRVLMFRSNSNIHGFVLASKEFINLTDHLNTWTLASVIRNVQEFVLNTLFPENFHLHQCLFTCKSLTKLVVNARYNRVSISLPDSVTLPSLKTLSLNFVKFEDKCVMDQLFSSCPVLDSLIMKDCEFPHQNINISSPQLQHLVLGYCRIRTDLLLYLDPVDIKFKLCASNLISLHYDSNLINHCALKNLSSLVKAVIYPYVDPKFSTEKKAMYDRCLVNILKELHNVEDLTLSASFFEVITRAPDLLDSLHTEFCNLRCLKLCSWPSIDSIHAISYLLKISPKIETLSIQVYVGAPDLLDMQPTCFCNLRCLKMYTFLSKDCIHTIAYFLKISPEIETLSIKVIYSGPEKHPYWDPDEITSNSAERGDCWKAALSLEGLLNHLKCVELLDVTGRINELEFLEFLLKNAMVLEKLLIVFQTTRERQIKFSEKINFNSPMIEENWEVELSSECLLNHLKCVEIRKAKGNVNELKFLETLLKNAVVLKTLMIVFATTEVSVTDRETRFVKFGEKLQAFPKASSSITIMLI